MKEKNRNYFYLTLFSGILLLLVNFLTDYLYEKLWIFYLIPILVFGLFFIIFFILTIVKKNKPGIIIGIVTIGILALSILLTSELFKSKKVLEASLIDDLSAIHLTLRENNKFEVVASTMFTEETYIGVYEMEDNKIIFKDKRYCNDFIPDTVYIIENMVIMKFKNGNPVTDFATYFEIKRIDLK